MKILIADDHIFVRKGISEIIQMEFPGATMLEASSGEEALTQVAQHAPDLVLLDIAMPWKSGIDVLRELRTSGIKTPVIMLSMQPENQYAILSIKEGASGFVNKATATEELIKAIHTVLSGRKYVSEIIRDVLNLQPNVQKLQNEALLSERELQVLKMIAAGKTVSEIAKQYSLTSTTVSSYRSHILEKLSLKNNADIIRYALEKGIV